MSLSDDISQSLSAVIERDGVTTFSRNELARRFNCSTGQINYVLSSRFTPERGFCVESRKGNGGFVRISKRCSGAEGESIMNVIRSVGGEIDSASAEYIIRDLFKLGVIDENSQKIMISACKVNALSGSQNKNKLRASLLKSMLLSIAE